MSPQAVYFDNAATTPLDPEVLEAMLPFLQNHFGNPSSLHGHGRQVRAAIENARKTIAHLLNAAPAEISFTRAARRPTTTPLSAAFAPWA
jgi:cysteine desulfurase